MPEGPEVKKMVWCLNQRFQGKWILNITWTPKFKLSQDLSCIRELLPLYIVEIFCKGKQIFFKLTKEEDSNNDLISRKYYYINSGLGMEGHWIYNKGNHSDFCMEIGGIITSTKKFQLITDRTVIYYDDSRHFGNIYFQNEEEFNKKFQKLGFDFLNDKDTSWERFYHTIDVRKSKGTIFALLTNADQKVIAGIGNYLVAEILYDAKISPHRLCNNISQEEWYQLYQSITKIMWESYNHGGLTIRTYMDPSGELGTYQPKVYNRKVDILGNQVIRDKSENNRTIHWVPNIQK